MKTSSTKQLRNLLRRSGACYLRRKAYEGLTPARAFQRALRSPRDLVWITIHVRKLGDPFINGWAIKDPHHPDHKAHRAAAIAILRAYAKRRGWRL